MSTEVANQRLLNSSRQHDGDENGYSLIYPRPGLGVFVPPGMSIRYIPPSREQEVSGHFIANAHSGYLDKSGCGATVTSAMARVAAWVTAPLAVV
ncbi:hypothetical protein CMUS01_11620 [Colletotrichum musicola]|uniref:Uncharacterized protein n=1 Tax=Colletotrichum musicola TaxID=2175873 RepID=A0A8H6N4K6_9PEZI|nr:hypothetical protein CMUS01_11620 [Colletotrichum musicola]